MVLAYAFRPAPRGTLIQALAPLRVVLEPQGQLPPRAMLEHHRGGVHVLLSQSLHVPP